MRKKLVSFQKHVLKLRKQHEYLLRQTGNTGQAFAFFDTLESTRVKFCQRTKGAD
jgi:hypothetical protein